MLSKRKVFLNYKKYNIRLVEVVVWRMARRLAVAWKTNFQNIDTKKEKAF